MTRGEGLAKTVLQGTVRGGRKRGRQKEDERTMLQNGQG